jgi:hypothetical protein
MAGGFSMATGLLGDLLGAVSSSTEEDNQEAYAKRASAWEKAQQDIDRNNQALSDRTQRRNQYLSSFGGGFKLDDPTYQQSLKRMMEYHPSDTAEELKTGADIMNYVSSLSGGMSGGGDSGAEQSTTPSTPAAQVDTNVTKPEPTDVRTAYNNRKTQDLYKGYIA